MVTTETESGASIALTARTITEVQEGGIADLGTEKERIGIDIETAAQDIDIESTPMTAETAVTAVIGEMTRAHLVKEGAVHQKEEGTATDPAHHQNPNETREDTITDTTVAPTTQPEETVDAKAETIARKKKSTHTSKSERTTTLASKVMKPSGMVSNG